MFKTDVIFFIKKKQDLCVYLKLHLKVGEVDSPSPYQGPLEASRVVAANPHN